MPCKRGTWWSGGSVWQQACCAGGAHAWTYFRAGMIRAARGNTSSGVRGTKRAVLGVRMHARTSGRA